MSSIFVVHFRAPNGCLQYFTENSGRIMSFNFQTDQTGSIIQNLDYLSCIRQNMGEKHFCCICRIDILCRCTALVFARTAACSYLAGCCPVQLAINLFVENEGNRNWKIYASTGQWTLHTNILKVPTKVIKSDKPSVYSIKFIHCVSL